MAIEFGLLTLGAYLLGSVPAAYLAARWFRGIDIRQFGTGNVGASNLLRLTSKRIAIPVTIFDVGKGALMIWVAQLLGLDITQQVTVGLAAIIGHNWPVFLRFNGGRGILTTLGIVFILAPWPPWLGLIVLVIAYGMAPFRKLALGTIIAMASLPIFSWFLPQLFGIEKPLPITLGFAAIFLLAVVRRLTAPRTIFTASVTPRQLFVNRLLFDRDIRDRKAWIDRRPSEQQGKQGKG